MISLIRLESDGKTLAECIKALDKATRQLGPFADELNVHDEHYERVHDSCFKGRRVFRPGKKGGTTTLSNPFFGANTSGTANPIVGSSVSLPS